MLFSLLQHYLELNITDTALKVSRSLYFFTPQPLRCPNGQASGGGGGRQREEVCLACISETVRCRQLILGRNIGRGCRCALSWSDLDLTCELAGVTLTYNILSGLYLETLRCRKWILGRDIG